jgi:hypothetical protein
LVFIIAYSIQFSASLFVVNYFFNITKNLLIGVVFIAKFNEKLLYLCRLSGGYPIYPSMQFLALPPQVLEAKFERKMQAVKQRIS